MTGVSIVSIVAILVFLAAMTYLFAAESHKLPGSFDRSGRR